MPNAADAAMIAFDKPVDAPKAIDSANSAARNYADTATPASAKPFDCPKGTEAVKLAAGNHEMNSMTAEKNPTESIKDSIEEAKTDENDKEASSLDGADNSCLGFQKNSSEAIKLLTSCVGIFNELCVKNTVTCIVEDGSPACSVGTSVEGTTEDEVANVGEDCGSTKRHTLSQTLFGFICMHCSQIDEAWLNLFPPSNLNLKPSDS